jgi:PEP-CTERM motif
VDRMQRYALAGLLACWGASGAHADLVTNGGFETGDFTGWTVSANATGVEPIGILGYTTHSGNYYAALGDTTGSYPYGTLSQTITDTAGQTLTLSYWLASNGTQPSYFDATWDGTTLPGSIVTNLPTQPYTEYSFTVTTTGSDVLLFPEQNIPNYLALDDVSLTPGSSSVPEPISIVLFGTGLFGLGLVGRRT